MKRPCTAVLTTLVALLSFLGSSARGQSRPYADENYDLAMVYSTVTDYPAAEVQAVPAAMARAAITRQEFNQAHNNLNLMVRQAVRTFNRSEDSNQAMAQERAAYDVYLAARERALEPLKDDYDYQARKVLQRDLSQKLRTEHRISEASLLDVLPVAVLKLNYAIETTAQEAALVARSSEVTEARVRLREASSRVRDLRTQWQDEVREDQEMIEARAAVINARTAKIAAAAYLAGVIQSRNIALDYAYYLHRYNPYRVSPYQYGYHSYYGRY